MHISKPTIPLDGGLVLRAVGQNDASLVASMHAHSWAAAYRGILPDAYLDHDVHAERAAYWQARIPVLTAGAGRLLIAEHGGIAVGFVCMIEPDSTGSVLVDNLHALPGHRGLGTGTVMLDETARWARTRGAHGLHLSVLEGNAAAIGFYESRGWTCAAREPDTLGGVDVFALRYEKPLD
jgi:GNAT superfamily N-acetyltransferase